MPTSFREPSCSGGNGNCVEAADTPAFSAVRGTRNHGLGTLAFGPAAWRAFPSSTAHSVH